jgi:hypothetical protein
MKKTGDFLNIMPTSNPAIAERNVTIAQKRLQGHTYRKLSKEFGISKTQVRRILNSDECRDIIETGTKEMLALVPKAVDNYREFLSDDDKTLRYKASKDLLETTGIRASRTENPVIQQYFNQTNINVIPPEIQRLLDAKADEITAMDADFGIIEPNENAGLQGEGD